MTFQPHGVNIQIRATGLRAPLLFQRERPFRPLVVHELDPHHEAGLADVAYIRESLDRLELILQKPDLGLQLLERLLFFEDAQVRQRGRTSERVRGIGVSVEERFEFLIFAKESPVDLLCRESS